MTALNSEGLEKAVARFESKYVPEPNCGCWLWDGASDLKKMGYGSFWLDGKNIVAHRAAYLMFRGPIPDGIVVMHKCDVPACVNPEHLQLGTKRDNTMDMVRKGRNSRLERHANAKLSREAVEYIRSSNESNTALALKFGVTRRAIWGVRNQESWNV